MFIESTARADNEGARFTDVVEQTKECPMCGDQMRVHIATVVERIPGTTQSLTRETPEWRCPECDYFEEIDDDELAGR